MKTLLFLAVTLLPFSAQAHAPKAKHRRPVRPAHVYWETEYHRCYPSDFEMGCHNAGDPTLSLLGMGRCECPVRIR